MSNIINEAANKIKQSNFILVIFVIAVIGFVCAVVLGIEDYNTSLAGYRMLPTAKVNDAVVYFVAILPQVAQIIFGWYFATDTRRRWAATLTITLIIVDVFTDVWFKAAGLAPVWWIGATIESIAIYTVGSEILLTTTLGIISELAKPVWEKLVGLIDGDGNNKSYQRPPQQRPQQPQQQPQRPTQPQNFSQQRPPQSMPQPQRPPQQPQQQGRPPINLGPGAGMPMGSGKPFQVLHEDEE
jgi:membrane peptidoglycan carboxypeptidase